MGTEMGGRDTHGHRDGRKRHTWTQRWEEDTHMDTEMGGRDTHGHRDGRKRHTWTQRWEEETHMGTEMGGRDTHGHRDGRKRHTWTQRWEEEIHMDTDAETHRMGGDFIQQCLLLEDSSASRQLGLCGGVRAAHLLPLSDDDPGVRGRAEIGGEARRQPGGQEEDGTERKHGSVGKMQHRSVLALFE